MATYHKGILGPVSGKVGDKVYSSWNGIDYVKSLPKRSERPASAKQLVQRKKFGIAMRFLSPIRIVLNQSYLKVNPKKAGLQAAARQIIAEAIVGEYPDLKIDFSKVSLIRGKLASPDAVMSYLRGTNLLSFCWATNSLQFNSNTCDQLLALIHCPSSSECWHQCSLGAVRADEFCSIQLPQLCIGHKSYVWLAYYSSDYSSFSNSVYIGEVSNLNPDDHENIK